MDAKTLADAQFDRAVEIVQGLPKTGPIQTGYEEKLAMYSLYKQATVGNVKSARPGMWDMLGRAKWDAWAKHKDLDKQEAKWLYVETLLKVLRKYSDRTAARDLVKELEGYTAGLEGFTNIDPSSMVISEGTSDEDGDTSDADAEDEEEVHEIPRIPSALARPRSALSSQHRYRTPLATTAIPNPSSSGVLPFPGPNPQLVPHTQPLPSFTTPSVFHNQPSAALSPPYPPTHAPYPPHLAHSAELYPHPYNAPSSASITHAPIHRSSPSALERAVESVQASLAALHERLESLEHLNSPPPSAALSRANLHASHLHSHSHLSPHSSQRHLQRQLHESTEWDMSHMGAWALVLRPLARIARYLSALSAFLLSPSTPNRSPTLLIIRRLMLDASFILFVLFWLRKAWLGAGMRRREVYQALTGVWWALVGRKERVMVSRGV
ncbi:hypothetical protein BOTBODRAFT_38532 [Botryobasidium botryosum FD-172 SS1]|uniref:ACB domain-containing protein n=1 Tax=Botryobasidium botryosum (strain FD-172 SS1) TaxID=930990 RepID=A0A067LWZ4_BOTB1|nr:hypothetical protein BOTBODRAFT_38532 [Botryobasidium botryosum FD-172 SS1]